MKHCEAVTIKVAHLADGKFMGRDIELPEGAPDIVAAIIDGDDIIVFGDGNGCVMTVESPDFIDGADVV